jgi:uncharacterized protein YunC (DUF1805 family)
MENEFNFYAPVTIQKGVGENADKMVIGGIASTASKDFDGEFMNPKGFDLSYFTQFGFINWAHQSNKDPLSIVGRPTKATIDHDRNQLYVEATLFKSNEKARQVYALGQILEAEGHHLAFSIEGKVTERDSNDPRKVLGAKITGCAITPTPKNNDSVANIIKGLDDNDFGLVKGMLSAFDDEGNEEDEFEKKEKSMGSESVAPLTPESVDGKVKNLTNNKLDKYLTKGQVLTILREDLPNTSEEMLEKTLDLIVTIEKSIIMNKPEISLESLNEAYEKLGISKGVESSEDNSSASTEELSKGADESDENEDEDEDDNEDDSEEKVEKSTDVYTPSEEAIEASKEILKSVGFTFNESVVEIEEEEEISKGIENKPETDYSELMDLVKGQMSDLNNSFGEKFGAVATIFKGLESKIEASNARNAELEEKINKLGNMSQGKRSITTSYVEKGMSNAPSNDVPDNAMSISRQKQEILAKGDEMCGLSKGNVTDLKLAEAVSQFESSSMVNDTLRNAMSKAGITLVG